MRYLFDTCAFLWSVGDLPELSRTAREVIEKGDNLFLSQATLWEIAIKKSIGKLDLSESITELVGYCQDGEIEILPIENAYFETIQRLPMIHSDPFDRMIIATAAENRMAIITKDRQIEKYKEVRVIW